MSGIHYLDDCVLKVLRSQISTVSLASAVTELVQNSIDAEATKVEVIIDIPKASFMVCDNGKGMVPGDLDKLGLHNVTSKLDSLQDLASLSTYGFRGEAIFCIANVSNMTIASKVKDYSSGRIRTLPQSSRMFTEEVTANESPLALKPFSINDHGTKIIVENLLHNTPVRRRILEGEPEYKTHTALKENLFQLLVLHPELQLHVACTNDSEGIVTLFSSTNVSAGLTGHQKLSYVFLNTFGSVVPLESLRRVSVIFKEFKLNGIISRKAVRVKDFQLIYINGREYHNVPLLKTIDNLFQTTVFENVNLNKVNVKSVGRPYANHAVIILDIRCPHHIDDLLQDRSKKLLSSPYADVLHPLILKVINSFLSHQGFNHSSIDEPGTDHIAKPPRSDCKIIDAVLDSKIRMAKIDGREIGGRLKKYTNMMRSDHKRTFDEYSFKSDPKIGIQSSLAQSDSPFKLQKPNNFDEKYSLDKEQFSISRSHLLDAEVINQVGKKFILLKIWPEKGRSPTLVIVDQHASDERIKLETYLKEFIDNMLSGTAQPQFIRHCTIDISATEAELFEHFKEELVSWGITYNIRIGSLNSSLSITSLPNILNEKFNGDRCYLKAVLLQMVHDMKMMKKLSIRSWKDYGIGKENRRNEWSKYFSCLPEVFREIYSSKACRSAVMFGDSLSKPECDILIKKLAGCWLPFQCAHGRPSMIPLARLEISESHFEPVSNPRSGFFLDYDADG